MSKKIWIAGWLSIGAIVLLSIIGWLLFILEAENYDGMKTLGVSVLYSKNIVVGEKNIVVGEDKGSFGYFIYAGMINDSIFSLVPGHPCRYNLYYPISAKEIVVCNLKISVISVTPTSFTYDLVSL